MRGLIVLILLLLRLPLVAQLSMADTAVVTRQCSVIRELVYQAGENHFANILESQIRSSHGHQTVGSWKFATTRYNAAMQWGGATLCYIEHNAESTDSFSNETWQYIAEYSQISTVLDAERLYRQLNVQIKGCRYPLNDSFDVDFIPLPPDQLPLERPAALEVASLYELPTAVTGSDTSAAINVMVGMEKRPKDYRVSLIVEYRSSKTFGILK